MVQANAPLSFPAPAALKIITYSLGTKGSSKFDIGNVPGAGAITSLSLNAIDDGSAGVEDITLEVRDSTFALKNNIVLLAAPVTVPSLFQTTLNISVNPGDLFYVSYSAASVGTLSYFVTIKLDTPIE